MAKSKISEYLDIIHKEVNAVPALKTLGDKFEEKTKQPVEHLVVGIAVVLFIMLFSGFGADMICHLAAFIYPFYMTLKFLEAGDESEITFWLVYWIVYGFIGVLENFITFILYWVPFFYPLKLSFILWCYLPQFKGAKMIYDSGLKPLFKKYESDIDATLKKVSVKKNE